MKYKRIIIAVIVVVVLIITGCGRSASTNDAGSFSAIKKEFDKRTDAQQVEYFQTIKGTEVTWSGEVHDAFISEPDKARHIVVNLGKAKAEFASFTIAASDKTDITKLNRGDAITIKGALAEPGGLLTSWKLTNGTVIK